MVGFVYYILMKQSVLSFLKNQLKSNASIARSRDVEQLRTLHYINHRQRNRRGK